MLFKNTIRKIKKSFGRYLSLIVIVFIGIAIFSSLQLCSPKIRDVQQHYYEDTNLMDYKINETLGLTDNDVESLKQLEHVDQVVGSYSKEVFDGTDVVKVHAIEDEMNGFELIDGRMPSKDEECLADANHYQVGDTIEITEPNEEDDLICKEYALKDKRIKYIKHKENKGSGGARMTALREAKGYAIGFADPDDTVALNAYEIAVSRMIINNTDIVCFNFYWIENDEVIDMHINIPQFLYGNNILHLLSTEKMHAPLWDKVYKKTILDKLGYHFMPEKIYSQDMVAIFKIFSISNFLEYIPIPLYFHYRRSESVTNIVNNKYITDRYEVIDNIFNYSKQLNIDVVNAEMNNFIVALYRLTYVFIDIKFYKTKQTEKDIEIYNSQRKLLKNLIIDNIKNGYITEEIFLDICNKRNLWFLIDLYNFVK